MIRYGLSFIGAAAAVTLTTCSALASTDFGFFGITNNSAANSLSGASQLKMTVIPAGVGVDFLFENIGIQPMSITDVYFDDGTLLALASVTSSAGVSFAQGASPPNLPGANNINPPFEVTAGFLADSNAPALSNGVNPGEWLRIYFSLQSGGTFADVIEELGDGRLRVGLHVQGINNGGSEAFVNHVPAPAGLGLLAMAGLAAARRRR